MISLILAVPSFFPMALLIWRQRRLPFAQRGQDPWVNAGLGGFLCLFAASSAASIVARITLPTFEWVILGYMVAVVLVAGAFLGRAFLLWKQRKAALEARQQR